MEALWRPHEEEFEADSIRYKSRTGDWVCVWGRCVENGLLGRSEGKEEAGGQLGGYRLIWKDIMSLG